MKIKVFSLLALSACLILLPGCIGTEDGHSLVDNAVNNSFEAKVNQHRVWVKVTDIDGRVSEVTVQARGSMVGDANTAAEISKQIGMALVTGTAQ